MNDTSKKMIDEYQSGISLNGIQKKYNIDPRTFKKILNKHNIHIRSREEQIKFNSQNQRIYTIDDFYFSQQSPNMVYTLGFLAANSCVYKNKNTIKIGLSTVDKEFLQILNQELKSTFPITNYMTKDGFQVSEVRWTSKQIKSDLAIYNIVPLKTETFTYPAQIDSQYELDFIRGYFDGDGSVSTAGKAIRWQVCSYKKDILVSILDILEKHGIPKVNIYSQRNIFYIQYSTNATKQIYKLLYYPDCLCLPRKQKKYETLIMK